MAGVAFKKTFSYAGFEMQPKSYTDPKIALLNIELELKSEKENAELRIENVEVCMIKLWFAAEWLTELIVTTIVGVLGLIYNNIIDLEVWWWGGGR